VVVLLGGGAWAYSTLGQAPATVALLFHQAGGIDLMTEAGFDRGVTDFGLLAIERDASAEDANAALEALSQEGPDLIFALTLATDVDAAAARHPDIKYVALEQRGPDLDNFKRVGFADEEGAYLAGAVAALKTETGRVGFIGGIDIPVIWRFHAGFVAGVRAVDPNVEVVSVYLTAPPNYDGFVSDQLGESTARTVYGDGVDVIFHAAGASGDGVFEAASRVSDETDTQLWVIGVDFDQYLTVGGLRGPNWQRHILTSVVKRIDVAIYETMQQFVEGNYSAEAVEYDLASNGIELSYSGGRIDQYKTQIEALREGIISGEISVPCLPDDRVQQAAELGLAADGCVDFSRPQ
jgi:basic membrane protein A